MSTRNSGAASVTSIDAARTRPPGARTVERLCDGRRKGDHGNRAPALMRAAAIQNLNTVLLRRGAVTPADKVAEAHRAGVKPRTVGRWWAAELDRQVAAAFEAADGADAQSRLAVLLALPRYLYRHAEAGKLQLDTDEIVFFAGHRFICDAIEAVHADPGNRLSKYGPSTLYAAYANVTESVRVGARGGQKMQRKIEATYPLTGRDALNESWSIDEYDLKVTAGYNGVIVYPKALIVRERLSDVPLAYLVCPGAATGQDTGRVLAAAALGFNCTHPRIEGAELRVRGVARHLNSDQGGPFVGTDGVSSARQLGIGMNPTASYTPQSNGDHEVMHQSLLRHFVDGPGSRRTWTDRAEKRLDHGVLPFEAVLEEMDDWFTTYLVTEFTKGDRKGRTRIEVYADQLAEGDVYQGPQVTDADVAALAETVAEHIYDPTRGMFYDNRYWLGPELASAANSGERIRLAQLLDPNILYAFDHQDRFLGVLQPRAAADVDDELAVKADRAARERFVEHRVARPKAAVANGDAVAMWDETADGLAAAAAAAAIESSRAQDDAEAGVRPDDSSHEVPKVVRPTNRRRRKSRTRGAAPAQTDTTTGRSDAAADADADAAADAVAALFRRHRDVPGNDEGGGPDAE